MPHQPFSSKDDLKKSFGKNIHFERVLFWCESSNCSESFIPSIFLFIHFFKSSWCFNYVVQQGIDSILSPKQQRRPLSSLLYNCFFYCKCGIYNIVHDHLFSRKGASGKHFCCYAFMFSMTRCLNILEDHVAFIYLDICPVVISCVSNSNVQQ